MWILTTHTHTHCSSAVLFPKINLRVRLDLVCSSGGRLCQCLLAQCVQWVAVFKSRKFWPCLYKFLQFHPAVWVDLTWWTCFYMILTLLLLLSVFVTMGTRLERTEVTLCGSNMEFAHRVLLSWEFHMVCTSFRQGHGVVVFFFPPFVVLLLHNICQFNIYILFFFLIKFISNI